MTLPGLTTTVKLSEENQQWYPEIVEFTVLMVNNDSNPNNPEGPALKVKDDCN